MIITVAIAFNLQTDEGQMLHFEPGQHDVPPEIAEHWYTRAYLVGGPVQRDADERAAAHQAYRDRSPREAGDAGLPEDPRSPRDRLMDAARAASLVPEPQQRRRGMLGLVRERLRLGRFGDLTADPEFLCTVTELIAAGYPHDPGVYWAWIDVDQPALLTGIAVELFLAVHAAPKYQLVESYRRTLAENPLVRQILFRPGATLRDGLLALAAHPEYSYLVSPELRAFLLPPQESAAKPAELQEGPDVEVPKETPDTEAQEKTQDTEAQDDVPVTPEQWMPNYAAAYLATNKKKLPRPVGIAACAKALGCGYPAAGKAYTALPERLKYSRGEKHP